MLLPSDVLTGHTEWPELSGIPFQYNFQCRSTGGPGGDGPSPEVLASELGPQTLIDLHLAYPLRPVKIVIAPNARCSGKTIAPGEPGTVRVALVGTDDFDVQQVEPSSLSFHGAKPISTTIQDFNGDGRPDLVLEFRNSEVRLSKQATRARLTGSLKSSQDFLGEAEVSAACPASK